jgi:hypothetical protein
LTEAQAYLAGAAGKSAWLLWQARAHDEDSLRTERVHVFGVHDKFADAADCPWLEIAWNGRQMAIPIAAIVSVSLLDS